MNQIALNNYFSTHWRGHLNTYLYSGLSLSKKIQPNEWVLDVGCGINSFKPMIANLVGIDPAFGQADYQTTIEDFVTEQTFDVAFCLGSINFGNETNTECRSIEFFPWSKKLLNDYAVEYGFTAQNIKDDLNNRIYCEWHRK
jgi:hypothetical protein